MSFSNHYGRYEDREWIIQFASEYVATYNLKETEMLVKAEKSKVNKKYAAIYNLLDKDFNKYIGNFSDEELIGTYEYIHSKNLCNEKELRDVEEGTATYDDIIGKIKNEVLFDDIPCVVDYVNQMTKKKRNIGRRRHNLVNSISDDNWGEPIDFSIEETLDMPVMGEVSPQVSESPKQGSIPSKIDDMNIDESHDNSNHGIFCVTGKDLACIDIDELV